MISSKPHFITEMKQSFYSLKLIAYYGLIYKFLN